jgi:hypothetical protein
MGMALDLHDMKYFSMKPSGIHKRANTLMFLIPIDILHSAVAL